MNFQSRFCSHPEIDYFIMTSKFKLDACWNNISNIVTVEYVYFSNDSIAIYSSFGIEDNKLLGTPLKLICLSCFLHILRRDMTLRTAILDDTYSLDIKPWRAPCESTALVKDNDVVYYMEGCKNTGIIWKDSSQKPITSPPFLSCEALDMNGGCWGADCPHGCYFNDVIEPFDKF